MSNTKTAAKSAKTPAPPMSPRAKGISAAVIGLGLLIAWIAGVFDTPDSTASAAPATPGVSHVWSYKVDTGGGKLNRVAYTDEHGTFRQITFDTPTPHWEMTVTGDYNTIKPHIAGEIYGNGMVTVDICQDGKPVASDGKAWGFSETSRKKNPWSYAQADAPNPQD